MSGNGISMCEKLPEDSEIEDMFQTMSKNKAWNQIRGDLVKWNMTSRWNMTSKFFL
jgi:hypothetical protein